MKPLALTLALLSLSSSPLFAHRSWVLPSMTVFSSNGAWVTFDAAISNDLFFPNHHSMGLESMKAYAPDGSEAAIVNKASGEIRSTFDLQLNQTGTYKIQTQRTSFSAQWKESGEDKRWRGTLDAFEKAKLAAKEGIQLTEAVMNNQTFVTNGKPNKTALAPNKKGLEIDFTATHPNDLITGQPFSFTMLLDGKPIEGVTVEVYQGNDRFRDSSQVIKATSDKDGKFEIKFTNAGRYWLTASHTADSADRDGIPFKKRAAMNCTFEVFAD